MSANDGQKSKAYHIGILKVLESIQGNSMYFNSLVFLVLLFTLQLMLGGRWQFAIAEGISTPDLLGPNKVL